MLIATANSSYRSEVTERIFFNKSNLSLFDVWEKLSKAFFAASTAELTSSSFPKYTFAISSSFAGLITGITFDDLGVTHSPLI